MKLVLEINGQRRSLNRIVKAVIIAVIAALFAIETSWAIDAEFDVQQREAQSGFSVDTVSW